MTVTTRAQWGARPPKRVTPFRGPARGVGVHYEGSNVGNYPEAAVPTMLRSIQNFHMDINHWDDGAYTLVVDRFGRIFQMRGYGVRTAANGTNDANDHFYAICVLIGPNDPVTPEIKAGVLEARAILMAQGCGPEIEPHSTFIATACPGPLRGWCKEGCPAPGVIADFIPPTPETIINATEVIDIYSVEAIVAAMPTIRQGSTGQYAKIAQAMIVANGEAIAIDGDFGPKSAAALESWQKKVAIGADGICGPQTWRRLHCI